MTQKDMFNSTKETSEALVELFKKLVIILDPNDFSYSHILERFNPDIRYLETGYCIIVYPLSYASYLKIEILYRNSTVHYNENANTAFKSIKDFMLLNIFGIDNPTMNTLNLFFIRNVVSYNISVEKYIKIYPSIKEYLDMSNEELELLLRMTS